MTTYRITYLLGKLDTSVCPPAVLSAIFPAFNGSQAVTMSESEILVTFDKAQTPVNLSPLVKVEVVPEAE